MPRLNSKPIGFLTGLAAPFFDGTPGTEAIVGNGETKIRIARGAFDDLGENIRVLFNADAGHLLGRTGAGTARVWADHVGLWYSVDLPDTKTGRAVMAAVNRGDISGSGFSFRVTRQDWTTDGEFTIRVIEAVDLWEVGPVTFPRFLATSAKVEKQNPTRRRERALEAIEFEMFELTRTPA